MFTSGSARAFYALLFLIVTGQSSAQSPATIDVTTTIMPTVAPTTMASVSTKDLVEVIYDVGRELELTCGLPRDTGESVAWTRNNTEIKENDRLKFYKEGTVLKYEGKSQEDDYGEYACNVGNKRQTFDVRGRTRVKLPANSNVVEGQNLRLTCKLIGKPYSTVYWSFSNETMKNVSVTEVLGHRAVINASDQSVDTGELLLQEVQRSDAGNYTCQVNLPQIESSTTTVRVKDKYAALWPFLGICIEVFVLCTIILVYEKRRTKPELDDSDTDNHDQKKS